MRQTIKKTISNISLSIFAMLLAATTISAAPIFRLGSGANPAAIQTAVDQFRADLGGVNNGIGNSFTTGRREINWDGVPDGFAEPNLLPPNFFNVNSPRGIVFSSSGDFTQQDRFSVSATAASGTAVRFGNINSTYSTIFQTFSAERLFKTTDSTDMEINFFIPGTKIPATVSGFGAVFTDVDSIGGTSQIRFYAADGSKLAHVSLPAADNGLSFFGVSFNAGERVARIVITSGNRVLSSGNVDGTNGVDVVAMDDFIYGEPRASQFHSGDFDGDGVTDSTVYRPSTGTWFTLNSGSNTVTQEPFGLNGDIPVDGDFDGDQRADLAIFRPSSGVWFFKRSSNGTTLGAQFGQNGDKPVVGDYDKDGKSDIGFWRPSDGNFFILRSSTNFSTFFGYPFGATGDIPVQGGAQ